MRMILRLLRLRVVDITTVIIAISSSTGNPGRNCLFIRSVINAMFLTVMAVGLALLVMPAIND